jgi:basic membrane protein A and related proteins
VSKLLVAAAVAALAVTVAGCGGTSSSTGTTAAQAPTTSQTRAIRVGLVTDTGQLNDRGFNQLAYQGMKRAERELGIQGRVLESPSSSDYIPNLSSLARQGYDLIVGVGFDQANAVDSVAGKFPQRNFAIVDVDQTDLPHKPANVRGLLFREQQVGYLAGYLAALVAKDGVGFARPKLVISTVGGQKQPPVDRFIAGYQAGAKKAAPGIELLNDYSQNWVDQAKCKELALNQIAAGSQVVFAVAGGCGLGALDAAKEHRVWAVGVDADQSYLGKEVLTSATKGVDEAVFQTIKDVVDGTFEGGNADYGLDQRGVGLGKISPDVPKQLVAKVTAIRQQIVDGKIAHIPTTVP